MKAFTALMLVSLMISISMVASPTSAAVEPSVGVKEGDWMEYNVNITGTPPPIHNVTWMRMDVLQIEDSAFSVNLTVRYLNGTFYSTIWKFNFTAGNEEGWVIIPSNLNVGDKFYDAYSKTDKSITIQSQAQQTLLGVSRTITYADLPNRHKIWDKATGVFVSSYETSKNNWTATVNMTATNLWSPPKAAQSQTLVYILIPASVVLAATALTAAVAVSRRQRRLVA